MNVIFVGGCDRSGTTFLASLLGGHSDYGVTPESQFKDYVLAHQDFTQAGKLDLYQKLSRDYRFRVWLQNQYFSQNWLSEFEKSRTGVELVERLVKAYVQNEKIKFWVDHTPKNIQQVGFLKDYFPSASFIHIVRDGRAVAASVLPLPWGPNTGSFAASWWCFRVGCGLASELSRPDIVKRIHFEDLVVSTEQVLKDVCSFCSMEYDEIMLVGDGFQPPGYTSFQHQKIGKSANAQTITKWHEKLAIKDRLMFEKIARPYLIALNYDCEGGTVTREIKFGLALDLVREARGLLVNIFLQKLRTRMLPKAKSSQS